MVIHTHVYYTSPFVIGPHINHCRTTILSALILLFLGVLLILSTLSLNMVLLTYIDLMLITLAKLSYSLKRFIKAFATNRMKWNARFIDSSS